MPPLPVTSAVLVAAGSSTRMGAQMLRKPLLPLCGATVLEHAAAAFDALQAVTEIVLVVHADDVAAVRALCARSPRLRKVRAVVPGGAQRSDSVRLGCAACSAGSQLVAVHDAARPLVVPADVERTLAAAARAGAALLAARITDTVKRDDGQGRSAETIDRGALWAAQTPQVFRLELLRGLLERAAREGLPATDESALHERWIGPVELVECAAPNLKVTLPADLSLAELLLRERARKEAT